MWLWELPLPKEITFFWLYKGATILEGREYWSFLSASPSAHHILDAQILAKRRKFTTNSRFELGLHCTSIAFYFGLTVPVSLQKVVRSTSTQVSDPTLEAYTPAEILRKKKMAQKRGKSFPISFLPAWRGSGDQLLSQSCTHSLARLIISVLIFMLNLSLRKSISCPKISTPSNIRRAFHPSCFQLWC